MASAVASGALNALNSAGLISPGADTDPYLEALPAFSYAMPVQVIVLGVTITLLSVLLVHLLFTWRYHIPLSKLSYCFQTTAVILNLGRTCGEIRMVMEALTEAPRVWPYMLDYIEVPVPPSSWTHSQLGLWQTLLAISALAVHCTHIQFLTLLFPSMLEARLILALLGPLALLSSFLYYTELSSIPAIDDLGDAVRNTANSTLTLLYTLALVIWGLTLNRSRAWRTDGGTAAFGTFALILGVAGTAINFLEVKEDRMRWLPSVVECVLLWQSWVGFWWWVGAGMWNGEAEELERKGAKKRKRSEAKKAKKELKEARALAAATFSAGASSATETSSVRRRRPLTAEEPIEMVPLGASLKRPRVTLNVNGQPTESVSSGSTPPPIPSFLDPFYSLFRPFLVRLRVAHDEAAVKKASEPQPPTEGWGLRQLGLRRRRERGERTAELSRGEVDAGDVRAGYLQDGAQHLEEWEDEVSEESDDDVLRRRRDQAPPSRRARNDGRIGEGSRWTQRGVIARWRLRERDTFD